MNSTPLLQLQDARRFEQAVLRSVLLGLAFGVLHAWASDGRSYLPTWYLAPPAALFGYAVLSRSGGWAYVLGAAYALYALFGGVAFGSTLAAWSFGGLAGLMVAVLRRIERERAGASVLPGWVQLSASALAGVALTIAGELVARPLYLRMETWQVPDLFASCAVMATSSFFVALSAVPAHLTPRQDPVEALAERVMPQLSGRFHELATRSLHLYRDCGLALLALPPDASRAELSRTLVQLASGSLKHAGEWSQLDAELSSSDATLHAAMVERVRRELAATTDQLAVQHLALALSTLEDESGRIDSLKLERVRALSRMEAEVALLTRARGALAGMRSGQVQLRSAELTALARKLSTLSSAQSAEAAIVSEVAMGAELDQLAAARASAATLPNA